MTALPRKGDQVWYVLDATDAEQINARRDNFQWHNAGRSGHKHPHPPGVRGATGHVAHIGTAVSEGEQRCAEVTEVTDPERGLLNLWAKLDGSDGQWVKGVPEGEGPGTWARRP